MRVLVVEDEARVSADIARALTAAGYVAEVVSDGEEAWFRGSTENYAAIVLDIGLPKLDGLAVLKRWRAERVATPIIMLTARGSWSERVDGIDAGADDYLAKPFRMEELLARVRSLIRRSTGVSEPAITVGSVNLDPRTCEVTVAGNPVDLTPLEYRLLSVLFHNRGKVISQSELSDSLYGLNGERDSNAIEALIGRLRRKLKVNIIETRRGFGYCVVRDAA